MTDSPLKSDRPGISPGLLADLTAAAPARLVKKLDATPELAAAWTWTPPAAAGEPWTIVTDTAESVQLRPVAGSVSEAAQVSCSCLLAPKCLHLLAVASILPVVESSASQDTAPVYETSTGVSVPSPVFQTLTAPQLAAVRLVQRSGARLLAEGAQGAGAILRAEWLRAAHAGRAESLPRLAAACTRIAAGLHALQTQTASFRLDTLTEALAEAITVAHVLSTGTATAAWIGTARRTYRTVGHLTLTGLFTEPVVREGGARGVRTWLRDASGRLYRIADIQPGDDQRARAAYDRGADIGDVSASHRAVGRAGLFLQDATASDDGRLGTGQAVRAVLGPGVAWSLDAPDLLFTRTLAQQVGALTRREDLDADDEADLVFFRAEVLGAVDDAVLLDAGLSSPVFARAALAVEGLTHRESLRALACAAGAQVLCAGRVDWGPRPAIHLLAVGGTKALPDPWSGRCAVGLDRLQALHLDAAGREPFALTADADEAPDHFEPLRARLGRLVLGGRSVLTPTAVQHALAAADALEARLAPAAAAALRVLSAGPAEERTRAFGAAHRHLRAAHRALTATAWGA